MNDSATTAMARLVRRRWRDREAPDGDLIVFADGSLTVMDLLCMQRPDRPDDPQAESWHWAEVLRATQWSTDSWVEVGSVLATQTHDGSRAWAGESASHGSIGWVALTRDDDESTLQWLAVSARSNPFHEVSLDRTALTARSTSGRVWAFPRHAPQKVRITDDPACPGRRH
ncbi:hypothetical protein EDD93_6551 [Streptomyces sp. 840.1]|uniref:hypothetical protein n=1 Tax=Streptomyces sp. 840.1 TaxID=2485152 RepID=UPI000F489A94|nr:hypothetical protein [Streptomyces sp. 840.1]ROQ59165.1 hypothetical protein EDD93_6551 [Streptomyces sp. 840.1]